MREVDFLIVGAGVCGLGAATRIDQISDRSWLVVEREPGPGGLSRTLEEDGFRMDFGGHVLFSHSRFFDDLVQECVGPFEGAGWSSLRRASHVVMEDGGKIRTIPYPFQKNLTFLSDESMRECLRGLVNRDQRVPPASFAEWISHSFGEGVSDKFMTRYNLKVWAHPLETMAHDWVSDRVAGVDAYEAVESVLEGRESSRWGPNDTFHYPVKGTGFVYDRMAGRLPRENQLYGASVDGIDRENRVATLSTGDRVRYKFLVSTMPLDRLMSMVGMAPDAARLRHSSTNVILLGFEGESPNGSKSWMYFPDDDVPFYRATVFSNYSPENTPDPDRFYSLLVEVSESEFRPVDHESLVEECLAACKRTGLVSEGSRLVKTIQRRAEYGYPTPSLGTRAYVRATRKELKRSGIYSSGRFGSFMYSISNQDGALLQGVQSVDNALFGATESWIETPEFQTGTYDADMRFLSGGDQSLPARATRRPG